MVIRTIFFLLLLSTSSIYAQNIYDTDQINAALKKSNELDILVQLKGDFSLPKLAEQWTKTQKAHAMYQGLKRTADQTQARIRQICTERGIDFQSFYVVNALRMKVDAAQFQWISSQPEVKWISLNIPLEVATHKYERSAQSARNGTPTWGIMKIQADSVWRLGINGSGAVVGGQDTGYEWELGPLKEKYRGWDGSIGIHDYHWHDAIREISPLHNDTIIRPENNPCGLNVKEPCDDNNHGTHTMGTMVGNDDENSIGVAPGAQWIACRNMERGYGSPATYIECFEWFLAPTDLDGQNARPDLAPDVINNSWGCPEMEGCVQSNFDIMNAAVQNLRAAGVVVVVSAGNSGPECETVNTPAAIFEASFSVGSTRDDDSISNFSSRGPVAVDSSGRLKPDVTAPGQGVRSLIRNGEYRNFSGTSMAGPHVAGLVALMISANPALRGKVEIIENIIRQTADQLTSTQDCGEFLGSEIPNAVFGHGRINALRAVEAALSYVETSTEDPRTVSDVKIFPNPTENTLWIQTAEGFEAVRCEIYNTIGQKVWAQERNWLTMDLIDVNHLPKGQYMIRIIEKTGEAISKAFVKY